MDRQEAKEFFIEECKKLPNRQMCCKMREEELERICDEKLDVEQMFEFLLKENLALKVEEFSEIRAQVVLYSILVNVYTDYILFDWEVWAEDDDATKSFHENAMQLLEVKRCAEINQVSHTSISKFLEYAKSNKPDL